MAVNELIIDVTPTEIEVALLQDKRLVELIKDKRGGQYSVGDIYLGKVRKLMPGLNAAFIDIGYEKDAFLHYLDLGPKFRSLTRLVNGAIAKKGSAALMSKSKGEQSLDKNGKIQDILSSGQNILVQISKEPISTKGPRLCSEISLAGRNLVLIPFSDKISISQKIESEEERNRLKKLVQSICPKDFGVIVRTVAEGKKAAVLNEELKELILKWESIYETLKNANPPKLVISEMSRTSALIRDMLNGSFNGIYVNDKAVFEDLKEYVSTIAPEKEKIMHLVAGGPPIFEKFGVQKQIKALFGRVVNFKNGSYLIIEKTEALHVIDVNSGNRSRQGESQEMTALEVNIAAAEQIAHQMRLRDLGGIIIVDFIDMYETAHRQALYEKMKDFMAEDKAKHTILPLTKFGLMQITRHRVRPEVNIDVLEKCPTCKGTGEITPSILIERDIANNLQYFIDTDNLKSIRILVHPYIAAWLNKGFFSIKMKWMLKMKCFIRIIPDSSADLLSVRYFNNDGEEIIQ